MRRRWQYALHSFIFWRETKFEYMNCTSWCVHYMVCVCGREGGGLDFIFRQRTHLQALFMYLKWSHRILRALKKTKRASRLMLNTEHAHCTPTDTAVCTVYTLIWTRNDRVYLKKWKHSRIHLNANFSSFSVDMKLCVRCFVVVAWNVPVARTFEEETTGENTIRKSAVVLWWKNHSILIAHALYTFLYFHKKFQRNVVTQLQPSKSGNDTILSVCFAILPISFVSFFLSFKACKKIILIYIMMAFVWTEKWWSF